MEKYIRKNSNVPENFITDLFDFSKTYQQNDFLISFDKIINWISLTKDTIKDSLESKFEENYDYLINKKPENIKLTPNCFKELCTLLQTTKCKEIRKNYISVENLIQEYNKKDNEDKDKKDNEDKKYKDKKDKKEKKDKKIIKEKIIYIINSGRNDYGHTSNTCNFKQEEYDISEEFTLIEKSMMMIFLIVSFAIIFFLKYFFIRY